MVSTYGREGNISSIVQEILKLFWVSNYNVEAPCAGHSPLCIRYPSGERQDGQRPLASPKPLAWPGTSR